MNSCIAIKDAKRVPPAVDLVRNVYKKIAVQVLEDNAQGELSGTLDVPSVWYACFRRTAIGVLSP